jgi:hypothetical protein
MSIEDGGENSARIVVRFPAVAGRAADELITCLELRRNDWWNAGKNVRIGHHCPPG